MEKLKQKLRLLHDAVFYAEEHWNIWMTLEKCAVAQNDSYEEYLNFLEPSRRAHFVSMLMAVCSVFDLQAGLGKHGEKTGKEYYGAFIDEIERDSTVNKSTVRKIKTILKRNRELINKARTLRDKNFAHAELKIEDALKEAGLTKKECATLIRIAKTLINEISRACGDGSFEQKFNGGETLMRLLGDQKTNLKKTG